MNKNIKFLLFMGWAFLMVWGLFGVFQRMTQGELLVNYGSYVPWGLWVASKTYFVGISVGAAVLACVAWAFDVERLQPFVRPALLVALSTMIAGLVVITFDLGHMFRSFEVFYRPNFSSLMAIATWLSFIHLAFLAGALFIDLKNDDGIKSIRKTYGWIGLCLAIFFSGGNGAEFATLISSPYWHSGLGPIMSIGGALLSGIAIAFAWAVLFSDTSAEITGDRIKTLSHIVSILILCVIILEWAEFSISIWYRLGTEYDLLHFVLSGPYAYVFWVFHIGLGVVVPLILLLTHPDNRLIAGIGALLAGIFYFAVKLNHVIPGQITPSMKGLEEAYTDKWLTFSYFPSQNEWAVFSFSVSLAVGLLYIENRFLSKDSSQAITEGVK